MMGRRLPTSPVAMLLATVAAVVSDAQSGPATASMGFETIKVSEVMPGNLLPNFFFMAGDEEGGKFTASQGGYKGGRGTPRPFYPPDSCPDELFDRTMKDLRVPVLPYLEQDEWTCDKKMENVSAIILENDYLRAAITPQWGGKVWSLYNKKLDKQMFFNNPAHQPENIGYRKAWTSGGAEWNWAPGWIGHSVFTEESVHAAKLNTEYGDVVRVWEYDRLNHTVWQVDMMLVDDVMFTHATITNPNDADLEGYWWTCVAMRVTENTRIVTPAQRSMAPCADWPYGAYALRNNSFSGADVANCRDKLTKSGQPSPDRQCAWQQDMSWLGNIPGSHDFFMNGWRPEKKFQLPYIAWVEDDGFTVMHSHGRHDNPNFMNGTKFFTWGYGDTGKFQCDFMSGSDYENPKCGQYPDNPEYNYWDPWCEHYEHEGQYTELQVGPAHSQMHTFPVPKRSTVQWSEWFKGFAGNVTRLHAKDYYGADGPVEEVEDWLASPAGMNFSSFQAIDRFLETLSRQRPKPEDLLHVGQPWGALHEKVTGSELAPGAPFDPSQLVSDPRTRIWLELFQDGTFSNETLELVPESFMVGEEWVARLKKSIANGHRTWLHTYLLAVATLEVGNLADSKALLEASMLERATPMAARALALIAPDLATMKAYYLQSWEIWRAGPSSGVNDPNWLRLGQNLANEVTIWLQLTEQWDDLRPLLKDMADSCPTCLLKDRVLDAQSAMLLYDGDYKGAFHIVTTHCFPTYGSDRLRLIQTWYSALLKWEEAKLGRELAVMDIVRLRRKIGCDGDQTVSNFQQPCYRGPPNLGIPYGYG